MFEKGKKNQQQNTHPDSGILLNSTAALSQVKSLEFLEEVAHLKENCGIKAANHVNQVKGNPLIDSPEVVNFTLEAIKRYNKNDVKGVKKNDVQTLNSSRSTRTSRTPRKIMEVERRSMVKLKDWLQKKMKYQKVQEKTGTAVITERIHSLNFAYFEACEFASHYCQEMGDIFSNIHTEYHSIYQYVIQCMTKHNLNMKKQIDKLQETIREKISFYEKQLLNIRIVHEEKSSKVIENFHKCINMKQHFEREAKKYMNAYTKEKNKLRFFQEALVKALNIILEIGHEKFKFLSPEQEKAISMLGTNIESHEDSRMKLFNRWCLSIIRNIIQLNKEKIQPKEKNFEGRQELQDVALAVIIKFMVEFDPTLSMDDARRILLNYSPNKNVQIEEVQECQVEVVVEKPPAIRRVPDIKQLCEEFEGISIGIQTNIRKEKVNMEVQTEYESFDIGITVKPKVLSAESTTMYWINNKMKIQKVVEEDIWAEKERVSKNSLERPKVQPEKNVRLFKTQNRKPKRLSIKKQKSYRKQEDEKTSFKLTFDNFKFENSKSNRDFFEEDFVSNSERKDSNPTSHRKVLFLEGNKKTSKNSDLQIIISPQDSSSSSSSFESEDFFQSFKPLKTQRAIYLDETEKSGQKVYPTLKAINREGDRRRALIVQNNNSSDLIKSITKGRSFKNLEEQTILSKRQIIKNKDQLLLNIIKIPNKIKFTCEKNRFINPYEFKVQLIAKLQEKIRLVTQSTMWPIKNITQIVKLANKIVSLKEKSTIPIRSSDLLFDTIRQLIEEIVGNYLKMYQQITEFQTAKSNSDVQKQLLTGSKLHYYHRLAPIFYIIVNLTNPFGYSRFPANLNSYYKGLILLKHHDKRLQILEELFSGTTVEFDIFIKTIYYLGSQKNASLQNQLILLPIIELNLFFILDIYLNTEEIYLFIGDLRNHCSKDEGGQKISFHILLLKIIRAVKLKKKTLEKNYKNLFDILGYEAQQSIPYSDLIYFLSLYPIDDKMKKKILFQASLFTVYWEKKQPCVPKDRLLFIFDHSRIHKSNSSDENFLLEYLRVHCEDNLGQLYRKIKSNPFHAAQSLYNLFFKVPQIVHKRTHELKLGKNTSTNSVLLTIMYDLLIEGEMEKIYMPCFFNALSCIPL